MKLLSLKEIYNKKFVAGSSKKDSSKNAQAVPKIEKVIVHVGFGKNHKDSQLIKEITETLEKITGQRPASTLAKKSIAGFKIREGIVIGNKVTLRGQRMWDFLDKLVFITLARTRDFQGIKVKSVDTNGNLNIGIQDHSIFPEIHPEKVVKNFGLEVTIVSTASSRENGYELFKTMGFPLQDREK